MDKNTVCLDVTEYNELRDFKYKIENGEYLVSVKKYRNGLYVDSYRAQIYTKDTTIKMLTDANDNLQQHINTLVEQLNPKVKEPTLADIKKMSYWEFRKWKKSN